MPGRVPSKPTNGTVLYWSHVRQQYVAASIVAGTTKTTPGGVTWWLQIEKDDGTPGYIAVYDNTTT